MGCASLESAEIERIWWEHQICPFLLNGSIAHVENGNHAK